MEYREFCDYMKDNITRYMPNKFFAADVDISSTIKDNGVVLDGILVHTPDMVITPKVYLNDYYNMHQSGMSAEGVCQKLAMDYSKHILDTIPITPEDIVDFDKIKERIVTKVVSTKENRAMLKDYPSTKLEDLSVLYQIDLGGFEDGRASVKVTNQLMQTWGITKEELHKLAVENTELINPTTLKTMEAQLFGFPENLLEGGTYEPSPMLVMTNKFLLDGASCIANPDLLHRVSEVIGDDFYILPSSKHEVLVMPKDIVNEMGMTPKEMGKMVREVNRTEVDKADYLSDHIYEFNRDSKMLESVKASMEKSRDMER